MEKNLIIGYGNPDRGDDGIAWHVLTVLCTQFGANAELLLDGDVFSMNASTDCWFGFQLVPEMSDFIGNYHKLIFLDAHTKIKSEIVSVTQLKPEVNASPLSHHLTPSGLLGITQSIGISPPKSILISIGGFDFGFKRSLSQRAEIGCAEAIKIIRQMIE